MSSKAAVASKVDDILKSIKKVDPEPEAVEAAPSKIKDKDGIPRGRPKSGRIWKTQKQRFSTLRTSKNAHKSFEKKREFKEQLERNKQASREILEAKKVAKEAAKERRRQNIKRTEEKRIKSEIVQVISNSSKIKRMKRKQLRFIEKRDTTKVNK